MGMEHYVKVRDLGGTNGAFLASDRQQPNRFVVIKRLAEGTQGIEELNAALRLRHPHVIRFLESFLFNGALYVVMDYEPGGDLEELFQYLTQRHKTPTTHTLLLWFVQLLEALTYCHQHHVIHRDIKPSNILVSEDTKVLYLGDFGSAKTLDTSNVTSTFVGSPLWISPEVLMGTKYSYAADIWSLGCVFYEMATLRKPFSAPSFAHLVDQITRGHIAPLPPNVAPEVRSIIQSMLHLQPAERTTAADALDVARAALTEAEARRNVTPTPIRSPAPPTNVGSSSPLRQAPVAPLVAAAAPPPPPPPRAASAEEEEKTNGEDDATSSVPPDAVTAPGTRTASTGASSPAAALDAGASSKSATEAEQKDEAAAAGEQGMKTSVNIPTSNKSPKAAPIKKRRNVGSAAATSSASASTRSNTPIPVATPPAAEAVAVPAEENEKSLASSTAEPCEPQQMVFNISTGDFRKPVARRRPVTTRTNVITKRAAAPSQQQQQQKAQAPPRQQVTSAPAPASTGAPNFVRQPTSDALAGGRRLSTTSAGEVVQEQRNSLLAHGDTKVVVKAAPPKALAGRAKTAAEQTESRRRVPGESPTRAAAAAPPLVNGNRRAAPPQPGPMVPAGNAPAKGAAAAHVPADEWLDQRMRELSAMENYLHQHRVDDDKVLQTYDARRNEEYQMAAAAVSRRPPPPPPLQQQHRSPAPRRLSPSKAFASPTRNPGVLVMSPPASHKPQPQVRQPSRGHPSVASPFLRQESYTRQPSRAGVAGYDSRQGSLASSYNGRQASNARPHAVMSEAEQLRMDEERAAAREKREAERQRMKALIQEQRAAAKKQRHKPKKGSAKSAVEVDILVPGERHAAAADPTAAI